MNEIKTGMMKSHMERLAQAPIDYPKNLCEDYEIRNIEQVVEDNRYVKKSVAKTVHPQDMFKGFKASDFDLENIIAIGALDSLKEGTLTGNTLNVADYVEGSVDRIINAVDSETNVNEGGE